MRPSVVWTLFRKELLDTLRDRRTLLIMVLMPMVMYPTLGILTSQAQLAHRKELRQTRYQVGVIGTLPRPLATRIKKTDDLKQLPARADWKAGLGRGKPAVVLQVTRPAPRDLVKGGQLKLDLYYVSTRGESKAVRRRIGKAFRGYRREVLKKRLAARGLGMGFVRPVAVMSRDMVTPGGRGRNVLAGIFPLILILMTVMGAFYPAIDLTAGEKERGTLETLLTAPVTSLEIVAGKYLAVSCIATATGAINLVSVWLTFTHGMRLVDRVAAVEFGVGAGAYLAVLGLLLLVALLASALMITIASLARSFKEGQNYVTPAYLVCMMPAMLPMMPGSEATMLSAMVPMVNVAFALRGAITGELTAAYVLVTVISMALSVSLALATAAKIFEHEQVLFREGDLSARGILSSLRGIARPIPNVSEALVLLGVGLLLMFYVGTTLQKSHPALGLGVTLWGLVLLPSIVMALLRKVDLARTFRLRRFSPWAIPGALLMAAGALPAVLTVSHFVGEAAFPGWQEFTETARKIVTPEHFDLGPVGFIVLLSISPGICEELMFRGFVQSALRGRLGPWPAIIITALLFGAIHLSVFRLLPTTLLGLVMGWVCYRSGSIFPAMAAHAGVNWLALSADKWGGKLLGGADGGGGLAWWVVLAGIVVFAGGAVLLELSARSRDLTEAGLFGDRRGRSLPQGD